MKHSATRLVPFLPLPGCLSQAGLRAHRTLAALYLLWLTASAALAVPAALTWSTTAGTGTLSTGSNWVNGVAPPNSGSTLTFSTSTTTSLTNDYASLSVTGITFNDAGAFSISGNAITTSGTILVSDATTAKTINTNLTLSANQSMGTITGASLAITGVISGGFKLTKTSPGLLQLSGINTYSGGTQINAGTVQLVGNGTLGNTSGTLTFLSSGILNLNGTSQSVGNLTGSGTLYNNASGTTSTFTIGSGNGTGGTYSGVIADHTTGTGTVAVTKTGTGSIALSGDNTFSGGTAVNAGTLTLGSSTTLSGATGLLAISGGTLATSVAATTIGGNLSLTGGSLTLNGTSGGSLTLAAGKTFSMSAGTINLSLGTSFDQIISAGSGTLALTGGTLSFDTTRPGFSYATGYQIFSGFGSASFSALTLSGYDTANYIAAISNNGLLSFSPSAIPEPSTYAACFGALALGFAVWRRRKPAASAAAKTPV